MNTLRLMLICGLAAHSAHAQLYVITGSPTQNNVETFASTLLRVDYDGAVTQMKTLAPQSAGTEWIGITYDLKKAVVVSGETTSVIDFEKAAVVKKCVTKALRLHAWLANPPGSGGVLQWIEMNGNPDKPEDHTFGEMLLDPAIPCDKSFHPLTPANIRFIVGHGKAGIADVAPVDTLGTLVGLDARTDSGQVSITSGSGLVPLEYTVPAELRNIGKLTDEGMAINDSHVFELVLLSGSRYRILVFRKSDKTWHTLSVPSERYPYLRGFGRYIAALEVKNRTERDVPRTPGSANWPSTRETGPDLGGRLEQDYPGRLFLYDVETERLFTIVTNEGDSEILLVEGSTVYYRVNDRIYSALIGERELGKAQLVAEDEAIRDAHWAFVKH